MTMKARGLTDLTKLNETLLHPIIKTAANENRD